MYKPFLHSLSRTRFGTRFYYISFLVISPKEKSPVLIPRFLIKTV